MSARSDANTDQVVYTGADIPSTVGGVSFCAWVKVHTDNNQNETIARLSAGGTIATFATDSDGLGGPGFFTIGNSTVNPLGFGAVDVWRFVAFSADGDDAITYAGTEVGSLTTSSTTGIGGAGVPSRISLFGRGNGDLTEWLPGSIANARIWFGVRLSEAEFEAERLSYSAVETTGLFADWPLDGDLFDISGNGRHLTAGSTPLAVDEDPPISAPAINGIGELTASNAAMAGTGGVEVNGSGSVTTQPASISGMGSVEINGAGSIVAAEAAIAGTGSTELTGTGSLIIANSVISGIGSVIINGAGALVAPNAVISGQESIYEIPSAKQSITTVLANAPVIAVAENRVMTTIVSGE